MGSSSSDDQSKWSQDVLLTEYEEAGEEFRYRDRLLHNTYYLLVTGAVLLTGSISQAWMAGELQFAAIQIILGGFALLFVGTLILNHFVQRKSANALRFRAAAHVEGAYEETPERPLSIPYWVVGKTVSSTKTKVSSRQVALSENYGGVLIACIPRKLSLLSASSLDSRRFSAVSLCCCFR